MEIKDCIVLLAGLGTRCYPFSYVVPKCMVPVLNKPVIEYIVEEAMASGIENLYFVLPNFEYSNICVEHFKNQEEILNLLEEKKSVYFDTMKNRKFPNIIPVYSQTPNGSGGAVLDCEKYLLGKNFGVMNGDDVFLGSVPALGEVAEYAKQNDACVLASKVIPVEENSKYGMFDVKDENGVLRIVNIIEKPKDNKVLTYANIGRYILNSNIFEYLKKTEKVNGEIYLTTALNDMAKTNKIVCKSLSSVRYDCGSTKGLLQANIDFAKSQNLI